MRKKLHLKLKKGALHRALKVPVGEKIPRYKIEHAAHSTNDLLKKRALFALNSAKWHHGAVKHTM